MAAGTDTDEDEEESDESSEDDVPLNTLAPVKRPGSAASTAASVRPGPRPSAPLPQTRATAPLISIPGVTSPPPRPPRNNRVPGVGVTRNSSLRGSRSVEDLGRKPVAVRPGPRPFAASPPSSTGDSSSGKAPLTPRDGSEAGRGRSDEARRRERRRSEAKKSVELANVINGPGPVPDDDEDHSQLGHAMMGMGWNQSGFFAPPFSTSQSMPFLHPQLTGGQPMPMGFMPPPPPLGASEAYLQAHHQAMMIAKQTYLSAVAQQAMAAATEQWERSSNMGGSVYGGSQMSMNMMMPMMSMYAGSSYAASAYEGSAAGWGSASAYGGGSRSVYGGRNEFSGARSEFGGGMRGKPGQARPRGKTQTGGSDGRREPVPPSTWTTRRKGL
ncbi:unnamed protein product [Rhizoctonia solani]|uniref:Uncharacterized protein n=1 Tax=Rhizoctonia solani TaxID=456999 RepID=A0A8H3EB65_9AGAM|nr:unnamed protein product [Rhizoctonia solani]